MRRIENELRIEHVEAVRRCLATLTMLIDGVGRNRSVYAPMLKRYLRIVAPQLSAMPPEVVSRVDRRGRRPR